ncbi:MAG: hypothetical protein A3B81_02600 [Candidatus Muproteobacteria bacterium RIFCSPHIGHO2_02_FULL_65_16]|uniref:Uncharacterized protein n=1 Tax=Candidatus Muproteobacteria bacterium RIFCSPHIGHO2_02_FULL_65_16 TaxID=1817766 RepID=A0A1F6TTE4_9PROT|nr:MAG: hypothetical protein A3B81_02600 [Candidatus Muproteobacteria bacterium RIFCSPHIGHO2_02_FULL_65_16]
MKSILIILALALLPISSSMSAPATSGGGVYEIEILVFENRLPNLEGGEIWTREASGTEVVEVAGAVNPGATAPQETPFATMAGVLEKDGNHRVLAHRRWRQSAAGRAETRPVRIRGGDNTLDGTLKFYLSRFLHVDVNLALSADGNPSDQPYRIVDHRRIKTQEINYFDHPKFGILLKVVQIGKE